MFKLSDRYRKYVCFNTDKKSEMIPQKIFWTAVITIFLVVNLPKDKLQKFIQVILKILENFFSGFWSINDSNLLSGQIVYHIAIPLKAFCFLISFFVIIYPIISSLLKTRTFWYELKFKRTAILALGIFLILSLLVFPYAYPHGKLSHIFGTSGMGTHYARVSLDPFSQSTGWYYRRLLKPAIVHFLQLDSVLWYYIFSLLCTYILIFLTVTYIKSKIFVEANLIKSRKKALKPKAFFLYYVSLATSIYANILIPSYPVILSRPASVLTYPYSGLYQLIHSFFHSLPT